MNTPKKVAKMTSEELRAERERLQGIGLDVDDWLRLEAVEEEIERRVQEVGL